MGTIQKLPPHLINRLKAGEIVERPASVVKELLENSLDAGATSLAITIEQGGKQLIKIQDNGTGISAEDMPLTIERYATSKIANEYDIGHITSYGFRGEALATISEVSSFRLQSKHSDEAVAHELWRDGECFVINTIPFSQQHGTTVMVEDIFHTVPAREKFLKTDATERSYIKTLCIDYALAHRDKKWILSHNGKQYFHVQPAESLMERVVDMTKPDRQDNMKPLEFKDEQMHIYGIAGDATLHFPKGDWVRIFVNGRPVQDRLLKKAIMDAYSRQIVPGTYPFVLLFVAIDPMLVDVNVHPRKQEVKFLDPGSIFNRVKTILQETMGQTKVNYAAFHQHPIQQNREWRSKGAGIVQHWKEKGPNNASYRIGHQQGLDLSTKTGLYKASSWGEESSDMTLLLDQEPVRLVGQLWQSYILLEGREVLYRVDQHALAERITFEKMKQDIATEGFVSEVLLQPMTIDVPAITDIDVLLPLLTHIGFDVSLFGEQKIIVHAVPHVFVTYKIDINLLMNFIITHDIVTEGYEAKDLFGLLLDEILGMKACKASIKAGQTLSQQEMRQLMHDAVQYIAGFFVCQHGRPSVVATPKRDIDMLFDRQ